MLLYPNAVFVSAPAGLYALLLAPHRGHTTWLALGAGGACGAALYAAAQGFYVHHPLYALHPQWPLSYEPSLLLEGWTRLGRHLGAVTPRPLSAPLALALAAAALAGDALHTGRWRLPAIGAVVLLGVLASFGIPKIHDGNASFSFRLEPRLPGAPAGSGLPGNPPGGGGRRAAGAAE